MKAVYEFTPEEEAHWAYLVDWSSEPVINEWGHVAWHANGYIVLEDDLWQPPATLEDMRPVERRPMPADDEIRDARIPKGRLHLICTNAGPGYHYCPGRCPANGERVPCVCSCHRHDAPHPAWRDGKGARTAAFLGRKEERP